MMLSASDYERKIENYSYAELLDEQERLFEYIPVLQKNAELEKKGEYETIGFVNPTYTLRLSHNREYLIVLERLLKKKEDEEQSKEFREMLEAVLKSRKDTTNI